MDALCELNRWLEHILPQGEVQNLSRSSSLQGPFPTQKSQRMFTKNNTEQKSGAWEFALQYRPVDEDQHLSEVP